jgi:hypothetical protein
MSHQACADGIALDVPQGATEVEFIQRTGPGTALPQVPGSVVATIDHLRIRAEQVLAEASQRPLMRWAEHQMHVIRHQAIPVERDAMRRAGGVEEVEKHRPILGAIKHGLPIIPTVREMVGQPGEDDAQRARHGQTIAGTWRHEWANFRTILVCRRCGDAEERGSGVAQCQ